MKFARICLFMLPLVIAVAGQGTASGNGGAFTLEQVMDSPFPSSLVSAGAGAHIAWTADLKGVRNVFVADGPDFAPRQLTHYTKDDGMEISAVRITPDGQTVLYARGSEHNSLGDTADPDSEARKPEQQVWSVTAGGVPKLLGTMGCAGEDCEDIQISPDGKWAVWPGEVGTPTTSTLHSVLWLAPVTGAVPARNLAWSQGNNTDPQWSPDSKTIAYVSTRPGHALIAIYTLGSEYVRYLSPSVDRDSMPRWSPDGRNVVFVRMRSVTPNVPAPDNPYLPPLGGDKIAPEAPPQMPRWELWVADAATGKAHRFWQSGTGPRDALYRTSLTGALNVGADHQVLFSSEADGWDHLYSVSFDATGGEGNQAKLLTPGDFEIEDVSLASDHRTVVFSSNQGDLDSRHLWRMPIDGSAPPEQITHDAGIEWSPVQTADRKYLLCLGSTATTPAMPYLIAASGERTMLGKLPADFPAAELVTPKVVTFPSTDNLTIHAELFLPKNLSGQAPAVIFVHGGSQRQMLPAFHYMDYYHNAYAENQFLVSRGFIVLAINYRTGIMYGHDFRVSPHTGRNGGAEYNDVVAAGKYLQSLAEVDPHRVGIWGGSYGGYLTAMALSRNSNMFIAGVDFHGVHDWSTDYSGGGPGPAGLAGGRGGAAGRGGRGEAAAPPANNLAFDSSPDAFVSQWKSPVLLIQGDDDRNVAFGQMIDMVGRLRAARVPFEQMVIPDEIHGFLRWTSWVRAYAATEDFLYRVMQEHATISTTN